MPYKHTVNAGKAFFQKLLFYSGDGINLLPSPQARKTSSPVQILFSYQHPFEEPCILIQ